MTPNDLRMEYNRETGNETIPSLSEDYDYVKWLEEKVIALSTPVVIYGEQLRKVLNREIKRKG